MRILDQRRPFMASFPLVRASPSVRRFQDLVQGGQSSALSFGVGFLRQHGGAAERTWRRGFLERAEQDVGDSDMSLVPSTLGLGRCDRVISNRRLHPYRIANQEMR